MTPFELLDLLDETQQASLGMICSLTVMNKQIADLKQGIRTMAPPSTVCNAGEMLGKSICVFADYLDAFYKNAEQLSGGFNEQQ